MSGITRTCRVCGKEYNYCLTNRPIDRFRWQDVACCIEHGVEYFNEVLEARSNGVAEELVTIKNQNIVLVPRAEVIPNEPAKPDEPLFEYSDDIYDDDDDEFDQDFDDDDDYE